MINQIFLFSSWFIFFVYLSGSIMPIEKEWLLSNQVLSINTSATCQFSQMFEQGFYFIDDLTLEPIVNFSVAENNLQSYTFISNNDNRSNDLNLLYSLVCMTNERKNKTDYLLPKIAFIVGFTLYPPGPLVSTIEYFEGYGKHVIENQTIIFILNFASETLKSMEQN